jgi:hypothetical protein
MRRIITILIACFLLNACETKESGNQVKITIENNKMGAPVTLGIPFPKGELYSVDHLRLLTAEGIEIPCQTTEVANWGPLDDSVKWVWVFFFSEEGSDYVLEYGDSIVPILSEDKIVSSNNMRPQGGIDVNTGPLSFSIHKMGDGFLDEVYLDSDKNGKFEENELIGSSPEKNRGSFLDLLDDAGIDASKAIINEVFREKGSGPMHNIFRVEGTYIYNRADNNISPFTMWVHAYAGKSFIKVLHTITYTGVPDKHKIEEGEHYNIATQNKNILSEDKAEDLGWTQPNDQIAASGIQLKYHLDENINVSIPVNDGSWQDDDAKTVLQEVSLNEEQTVQLLQKGPERRKSTSLRSLYRNGFKKGGNEESNNELQFEATV